MNHRRTRGGRGNNLEGHHVEQGDLPTGGRHDVGVVLGQGDAGGRLVGAALAHVVGHGDAVRRLPQLGRDGGGRLEQEIVISG